MSTEDRIVVGSTEVSHRIVVYREPMEGRMWEAEVEGTDWSNALGRTPAEAVDSLVRHLKPPVKIDEGALAAALDNKEEQDAR